MTEQYRARHGWWLLAIAAVVVALHGWATWSVSTLMRQLAVPKSSGIIKRMEAAYVSELQLATPPVIMPAAHQQNPQTSMTSAVPAPAPRKRPRAATAKAASAPEPADSPASAPLVADADSAVAEHEAEGPPPVQAVATEPVPSPASGPVVPPDAAGSIATGLAPAPAFVWPLATRVSYRMDGHFRGEVHGSARVEWVRQDERYQVRVEALIGPRFAAIGSWNLISEGTITPDGLSPQRFEQIDRLLLRTSPPRTVTFEDAEVVLDAGQRVPRQPGMQDGASQFIQLAYRFMREPGLLRSGNVIHMPLALLKRSETIAYHVQSEEMLHTPLGQVATFHVKPQRMDTSDGVLPVEIWFAPSLQYLPVRILVHGKENSFMDLKMERAPQQTAAVTEVTASAPTASP